MQQEVLELRESAVPDLINSIRIPSYQLEKQEDSLAFRDLDTLIFETFPLIDSFLERKTVNQFSSIYQWQGKNPEAKPILIFAQKDMDTTMILANRGQKNIQMPSMKERLQLFSILESIEMLLAEGYRPERSIYLGLSHDVETGGYNGSVAMANWFESQNLKFEYILDKGSEIKRGVQGLAEGEVALIGLAEKGCAYLDLNVETEETQSVLAPDKETAASQLIEALASIKNDEFPTNKEVVFIELLDYLGAEGSFWLKLKVANKNIFSNGLMRKLSKDPEVNAMLRTSAETIELNVDHAKNRTSHKAHAQVLIGVLPGESIEASFNRIKKVINNPNVELSLSSDKTSTEPPPVSNSSSFGFNVIQKTLRSLYPNTLAAPVLVPEINDSRYFSNLTNDIYRFVPFRSTETVGSEEERNLESEYQHYVNFYYYLIKNSTE